VTGGLGVGEGGEYAEKTLLRQEGRTFVWKATGLGAAEGSTLLFLMGEKAGGRSGVGPWTSILWSVLGGGCFVKPEPRAQQASLLTLKRAKCVFERSHCFVKEEQGAVSFSK